MKKRILSILLTLCMVLMLVPTTAFAEEQHVYRVAGDSALCGSNWDATDDNNRMTFNGEMGRYEKVYTGIAAGTYAYKIAVDGVAWIPDAMGAGDPTVAVDEDNATVTIWYVEETGEWGTDVAYLPLDYTVTQNFKYGTRVYPGDEPRTNPYSFEIPAGGSFGLATVEGCAPYELVGWKESVSGTVYAPFAEIDNLSSDLTFDAVYQVQGGLAVTVDGFMPGNTPADCTYSFESTIPGVTFSADDFLREVSWYRFDGANDVWTRIVETAVFEAGARYQIGMSLNNKGLELAPSVTVNGIAVDYCELVHNNGVPYAINIGCELGTPVAPTLAVTVDNFELGKTLNDCTFSFESTNLDVTFDESDILSVTWEAYDSWLEDFYTVDGRDVLQDIDYRCTIELDSKGLTEAPAVTVNGRTPESCEIGTSGGKSVLRITCELGVPPAPPITISAPGQICAQQDCEFSATASEGAEISYFVYRLGDYGADTAWSRIEDGVCYGTVPASEYGDADSIELTVYGTAANGRPVTATATVWLTGHIYENGVCGCGAVEQYTITYHPGMYGTGSIPAGTKTYGEPLTLSSETFKREGYVQTGWRYISGNHEYDLGGTYTLDEGNITLYPVWEKIVTVTAPFTTTVALGDAGEPGETTFMLGLIDSTGNELTYDDQYFFAEITTDGAGSYSGVMTITATEKWLCDMLYEGAFIWQYDDEEDGWTYDDTVWGVRLYMPEVAARSADEASYELLLYPAYVMDDGSFNLDLNAGPVEEMTFTNTYTAHAYALNHDADGHWDECAGCEDKQNAEPHKYGDWTVTKEATEQEAGEKEHTCTVCGYTEKAEIEKLPATTDPTKPGTDTKPGTTSPATGDNSHMALWIALLFVSVAGVIGTTVYGRKKRAK